MKRLASFFAALGAALTAPSARAELPLESLALNDTASVQEQFELQATLAPAFFRWNGPRHDAYVLPLELEFGILDGVQLAAELPVEHHVTDGGSATGLGNAELAASVALVDQRMLVAAAGVEAELPAPDERIGEDTFAAGPFALADVAFGSFHVSAGVGLEFEFADETELVPGFGGAVYAEFGRFVPVVEMRAELGEASDVRLAPGLFVNLSEAWEIGASGVVGVTNAAPDIGAVLVVTFEAEFAEGEGEEEEP